MLTDDERKYCEPIREWLKHGGSGYKQPELSFLLSLVDRLDKELANKVVWQRFPGDA